MANPFESSPISKAEILSQAGSLSGLSLPDRRINALHLIELCVTAQVELSAEIFDLVYGDRTGSAYWAGWLADDFSKLYEFIRFLEAHRGRAQDILEITKSPVLEAISIASRSKPSWLENIRGEDVLGTSYHPQHLANWYVCRGAAVRWLQQHPEYKELLPSALADDIAAKDVKSHTDARAERTTQQKLICKEVFSALYPGGIPTKGRKSNKQLVGEVRDFAVKSELKPPSEFTILRSAGRKPIARRPKQ